MFFGRKKTAQEQTSASASLSSSSGKPAIVLEESKETLKRSIVNLAKTSGIDLGTHKARVAVVMDKSGSMSLLFNSGAVQDVLTRLLPLALKFDDNGELEVFLFNRSCLQLDTPINISNYENFVEKEIMRKGHGPGGGTCYEPAILNTMKYYNDGSSVPAFVIFITDGDNDDKDKTDIAIRKSSSCPIFYQFIGIGTDASFNYLRHLDNLSGREVDNTAFLRFKDLSKVSDDDLYSALLEQYPQWLRTMHLI